MNCPLETRENAQLLLDYCTRKLEPESVATLDRHIAICGACREFARSQRAVWEALDAWQTAPVSTDFDSRLYRRIEGQVSWWDGLLRPFRPPFSTATMWRSLPAAACPFLLVGGGGGGGRRGAAAGRAAGARGGWGGGSGGGAGGERGGGGGKVG